MGCYGWCLSYPAMVKACQVKTERDTEMWTGYFTDLGLFRWGMLKADDPAVSWPQLRLTVDTPEDFELVTKIFDELYEPGKVFPLRTSLPCAGGVRSCRPSTPRSGSGPRGLSPSATGRRRRSGERPANRRPDRWLGPALLHHRRGGREPQRRRGVGPAADRRGASSAACSRPIPPADLAIQWDLAYETQDIEGVLAWTPEGAWERFAGPVTRLTRLIPDDVLVGYHLCYGTFPEWPCTRRETCGAGRAWRTSRWRTPDGPSTGCTWPGRGTCAARTAVLPAARRPRAWRRPGVPRHRAADRRGRRGCGGGRHRRRATCATSASRCTAASAVSPAGRAERCANTGRL